jgi:pimeloyl-ACP methyl ester carboxylesterase
MTRRALAIVVVVVLGVLGLATTAAVGAPSRVPDPGKVLDVERRADGALDVRYQSVGLDGRAVAETAVVWLPTGPRSGGVVAWGHPTTGLGDRCAPSATDDRVPGLDALLAAGHVVVAPDYEGLGAPGSHPYLVGTSEGRSVLDALRAARTVAGVHGRSAVYGWSQGGHAALFAARLAPSYAPDVRLAGVVAIAPVVDMTDLVDPGSTFGRNAGFVAMVAAGFASTYDDLDPTDVVPDAEAALPVARRACSLEAAAALDGTATTMPGPAWTRRLRQNDPSTRRLRVPVLLVHGERDALLPFDATLDAYDRLCRLDTPIRLADLRAAGHGDVVERSTPGVVTWLAGRLAGNRLTGCERQFG